MYFISYGFVLLVVIYSTENHLDKGFCSLLLILMCKFFDSRELRCSLNNIVLLVLLILMFECKQIILYYLVNFFNTTTLDKFNKYLYQNVYSLKAAIAVPGHI